MLLITDSREQEALIFPKKVGVEYKVACLGVGDYTASYTIGGREVESSSVVERKSKADLFGSYTSGYENERKKFIRAKELGKRFILAVEEPVSSILKGHTYTKGGVDYTSKKDGMSMLRQLMMCCVKYGVTLWTFNTRGEMALQIQEYFLAEERFLQAEEKVCKESMSLDHIQPKMESGS